MIAWMRLALLSIFSFVSINTLAADNELNRLRQFISESHSAKASKAEINELLSARKKRYEEKQFQVKAFSYDQPFYGIVGKENTIRIHFIDESPGGGNGPCSSSKSYNVTLTGSPTHVLAGTSCNISACNCYADVKFTPVQSGITNSVFCVSGGNFHECSNFIGKAYKHIDPPEKQECSEGSIIGIDTKTVAEKIPVVGAPFDLYYSSYYSETYDAPYDRPVMHASFNPENLTISILHYYHKSDKRLFLGTGSGVIRDYITDSSGNTLVVNNSEIYLFDNNGRHVSTKSALTGFVKFNFLYDSNDKIIKITDAHGNETIFTRDSNGVLQTITSPYSEVTSVVTNTYGYISQVTNPNNETYSLNYSPIVKELLNFEKPNGNRTSFKFNSNGWLYRDTGAGGNYWDLSFYAEEDDFIIDQSSAMERYHTYVSRKNPDTNRFERQYFGPAGFETLYTEGDDKSSYSENIFEKTGTITAPDERFGFLHDRVSGESTTINGITRETIYNQTAVLSDLTDYFSYNQIIKTTSVNGKQFFHTFDKNLMTHTYTNEMGVQNTVQINQFEKPVQTQFANDVPVTITYNSKGQVTQTTQNGTNTTKYTYNAKGRVASIRNALNEVTRYSYDNAGRTTRVTLPDGRFTRYIYNKNGQIIRVVPAGRPAHNFVYNLMELPSFYRPPIVSDASVVQTRYSYDQDKNLILIKRPDNKTVRYNYEPEMGHLMSIVLGQNQRQTYSYYEYTDNIRTVNSPDGVRSSFTYFGKDELASEQQSIDSVSSRVTFTFDNFFRQNRRIVNFNGNEVSRIGMLYRDDHQLSRVGDLRLTYDTNSGRVISTILDKVRDRKTYDSFGNLESYRATYHPENAPVQELYFYKLTRDTLHRIVTKIERVQGIRTDYAYSYDSAGRLSSVTKNGVVVSSFLYDMNSNRISGTQDGQPFTATFDDQDRMLNYSWGTEDQKQFTYNANGELTQIDQGSLTTTLTPDSLGRLKSVTLPNSDIITYKLDWDGRRAAKLVNGLQVKRSVYENKFHLAGEIDSFNTFTEHVSATHVNSSDYLKKNGELYRIFKDHLGSPRLIVKASDGSVAQKMSYNEWGKVIEDTNPGFQPFGFAGGMYDHETKLVKFGARDYDGSTGRWLSKDPIRFEGGDTNLYGYVLQDPVNFLDFEGLAAGIADPTGGYDVGAGVGDVAVAAAISAAVCNDNKKESSEHTKNKRKSTKNKHEKGQKRKNQKNTDKKRQNPDWHQR